MLEFLFKDPIKSFDENGETEIWAGRIKGPVLFYKPIDFKMLWCWIFNNIQMHKYMAYESKSNHTHTEALQSQQTRWCSSAETDYGILQQQCSAGLQNTEKHTTAAMHAQQTIAITAETNAEEVDSTLIRVSEFNRRWLDLKGGMHDTYEHYLGGVKDVVMKPSQNYKNVQRTTSFVSDCCGK